MLFEPAYGQSSAHYGLFLNRHRKRRENMNQSWRRGSLRDRPTVSRYATNPLIMDVLANMPEFKNAAAVADNADRMLGEIRDVEDGQQFDTETFFENGGIPSGWLDSIAAKRIEREVTAAKRDAATALRETAIGRIETIAVQNTDVILAGLNSGLTAALSPVYEAVANLKGATTASETVEFDSAAEWKTVTECRARMNHFRAAQTTVMVTAGSADLGMSKSSFVNDERARDTIMSNLDDVFPEWRTNKAAELGVPWPTGDPDEYLVWCIRADAKFWVPTLAELRDLAETRKQYVRDRANELQRTFRNDVRGLRELVSEGKVPPLVQEELWSRGAL